MKEIRLLIVEDDPVLLPWLKQQYREIFAGFGFETIAIEEAINADEARALAKGAEKKPYDLVSLDVNLGGKRTGGAAPLTGLDVLLAFKRFKSAWMVALLTGVETDTTLNKTLGNEEAETIRKQLRREAYANFWPERLLVVEKPPARSFADDKRAANELLRNRLEQIALVYGEVSRQRYIFRPIEVKGLEQVVRPKGSNAPREFVSTVSTHWQIRFNCEDIRTLSHKTGFRTLHKLLSLDRTKGDSLTPEAALVIEPKHENEQAAKKSGKAAHEDRTNPFAEYFGDLGIDWGRLGEQEQERLVQVTLRDKFTHYIELRELEAEEDLSLDDEEDLEELKKQLGVLTEVAEGYYQKKIAASDSARSSEYDEMALRAAAASEGMAAGAGNYEKREGGRGVDSPAAAGFRARIKRVKKSLRENGFTDFADHLDAYLSSTGANWSYHPPSGIEWTL